MKTNKLIQVKTINSHHVSQLPYEHYWNGEYDWSKVNILGRLVYDGCILVQEKTTGALHKVAPIAFIDVETVKAGYIKGVTPPPHTKFVEAAQAVYQAIPELFLS